MMTCQICGDQNGPWEYQEYKNENGKPWLIKDGETILVCEECAKIIRKRISKQEKLNKKNRERWQRRLPIREV